tara:strand:- start:130 stop:648 length:519 start_codon:yes stop_codon:yes gene_type:complete
MSLIHGITSDGYSRGEAAHVLGHALAVTTGGGAGQEVVPQVATVDTSFLSLGPVADIFAFRVAVDAAENTDASNRLFNGHSGVGQASLGQSLTFALADPVTRLDVIGIADLAPAAQTNNCMGEVGAVADALAEMTTFIFPTAVSRISVSCSKGYTTTGTPTAAQLHIQGWAS